MQQQRQPDFLSAEVDLQGTLEPRRRCQERIILQGYHGDVAESVNTVPIPDRHDYCLTLRLGSIYLLIYS